jgi:CysZ protein
VGTPLQPRATALPAPGAQPAAGSEFFTGMRLLGRGFGLVFRSPLLLLLGIIPGIIAGAIVLSALGAIFYFLNDIAAVLTWFADDWSKDARNAVRVLAAIGTVLVSVLVAVFTFTALTLTIGDPFYEIISKRVEERYGGARDTADLPWFRTFRRNLADSLRLLAVSILASVLLFVAGFIPVIGQTVVPVLDAVLGGWLIAVEVSGIPFNRRGYRLRDRRRLLGAHRSLALGFGVPVFLLLLVPFAALLVMPCAVAGATLLTRRVLGQPHG